MISELGFVYRLLNTEARNTVKVWLVSQTICRGTTRAYLESVFIAGSYTRLRTIQGA